MNISVSGRHMEMTSALHEHVNNEVGKLSSHLGDGLKAEVVLSVERHEHVAEVNLSANGLRIHSREKSPDMYASVDAAVGKLERQIKKHKDKIAKHKPRNGVGDLDYGHRILAVRDTDDDTDVAETDLTGHHVVHYERVPMKPMTVDEAVLQLELADDLFLTFLNADTSLVNVLYARRDGTYGLIEPKY